MLRRPLDHENQTGQASESSSSRAIVRTLYLRVTQVGKKDTTWFVFAHKVPPGKDIYRLCEGDGFGARQKSGRCGSYERVERIRTGLS